MDFVAIVSSVLALEHLTDELDKFLYNETLRGALDQTLLLDKSNRIDARQARTFLAVHFLGLIDSLARFIYEIVSLSPFNQRNHTSVLGDFYDLGHGSILLFLRPTYFIELS